MSSLSEFHGILAMKRTQIIGDDILYTPTFAAEKFDEFRESFISFKEKLSILLNRYKAEGKSIAVWGAGARGITTLMRLNISGGIVDYIVDSDDRKIGKYIPTFSTKIRSPDVFYDKPTDILIITSVTYNEEIISTVKKKIKPLLIK